VICSSALVEVPHFALCASGTMSEPMKVRAEISALAISTTYLLS
jgi:hypothetical protein